MMKKKSTLLRFFCFVVVVAAGGGSLVCVALVVVVKVFFLSFRGGPLGGERGVIFWLFNGQKLGLARKGRFFLIFCWGKGPL